MPANSLFLPVVTPDTPEPASFTDAAAAVARLEELYAQACGFLTRHFSKIAEAPTQPGTRFRAFYPEIRLHVSSHVQIDSRLAFGHVSAPGTYSTTVTRPDLFRSYLTQQIGLLIQNHGMPVSIGVSTTPIPVHFAVAGRTDLTVPHEGAMAFPLRDVFDVPDLSNTNDDIVNGFGFQHEDGSEPLAPFTAQRIDYSLARLSHYTATDPEHFQNHVLFTNYQFYIDEFETFARAALADPALERITLVKAARCGFTSLLTCMIGHHVANNPASILSVLPTESDCHDSIASDVEPIFEASPSWRGAR